MIYWSGQADELPAGPCVLTIGVFDGIHIGHARLLSETVEEARRLGVSAAAITFFPSPESVLRGITPSYLLMPQERADVMSEMGVDLVVVAQFSETMAAMGAQEFMGALCANLQPQVVWVGDDFALGRHRCGGISELEALGRDLGYRLAVVARTAVDGEPVSSTRVRRVLDAGDVREAATLLGRPYSLRGTVVRGDGRGRLLGFPTANVGYDPLRRLPVDGVYATWLKMPDGSCWPSATSIGVRPTFVARGRTVEAFVLDFHHEIYGQEVCLEFVERLRPEECFPSAEALIRQMGRDVLRTRELLGMDARMP